MSSMLCPECNSSNVWVIDSRPTKIAVRRRRKCKTCDHRWSTLEMDVTVISRILECAEELEMATLLLTRLEAALSVLRGSDGTEPPITTRSIRIVPDPVKHRLGSGHTVEGEASGLAVPQGGAS